MANEPLRLEADLQYEANDARQEVDGLKTAVSMFAREMRLAQYQGHLLRRRCEELQARVAELEAEAKAEKAKGKKS